MNNVSAVAHVKGAAASTNAPSQQSAAAAAPGAADVFAALMEEMAAAGLAPDTGAVPAELPLAETAALIDTINEAGKAGKKVA